MTITDLVAPEAIVPALKANSKKQARLNVIRHLLSICDYKDKRKKLIAFDESIVFRFSEAALSDGSLAA